MMVRRLVLWGLLLIFGSSLLGSCAEATEVPLVPNSAPTSVPAPVLPTAVQILPTEEEPTAEPTTAGGAPAAGDTAETGTPEGSVTPEATATQANPIELPFLMKIDRVSVVVGKGTLLEGRVAHGTLPQNSDVEILGPQNTVLGASVLATFVSSVAKDQVTVGDYARVLVENVDTNIVKPGLLVAETGAYTSYEEALAVLQ